MPKRPSIDICSTHLKWRVELICYSWDIELQSWKDSFERVKCVFIISTLWLLSPAPAPMYLGRAGAGGALQAQLLDSLRLVWLLQGSLHMHFSLLGRNLPTSVWLTPPHFSSLRIKPNFSSVLSSFWLFQAVLGAPSATFLHSLKQWSYHSRIACCYTLIYKKYIFGHSDV